MLLDVGEQDKVFLCAEEGCGGDMVRTPAGFSSQTIESLDNGIMARRVERYKDIEQLAYERSHTDYKKT